MAVSSSRGRTAAENGFVSRKWKETTEISPERNKVWIEPTSSIFQRKVSVVYYLSRDGQLQQPHFMEVPLSSNAGLYLRDVMNRLNLLRGKGMANLYSWSSKRSYKNGFVWHDLAENDFIYPSHGQEYVLKGSEILDHSINPQSQSFEITSSEKDNDSQSIRRRRDPPRRSIDLHQYKVYTSESSSDSNGRLAAADASTQTDDKRRRRKPVAKEPKFEKQQSQSQSQDLERNQTAELSREDISPPPSDSSSETLESLMKADTRAQVSLSTGGVGKEDNLNRSGRMKASSVLRQLISCGSISVKECGPNSERDQRFSLVGHYKSRLPRGLGQLGKEAGIEGGKEYFSGSLIENKREEVPDLKRSSSCNSERSSRLQLADNGLAKKQGNMNANSSAFKVEAKDMVSRS